MIFSLRCLHLPGCTGSKSTSRDTGCFRYNFFDLGVCLGLRPFATKMGLAGGRTMKYPYTVTGKLALFPYRWHWKNGRFVRFLGYTLVGLFPLIVKIHSSVHSPGNVRQWEEIRKKREHTHFDPVH